MSHALRASRVLLTVMVGSLALAAFPGEASAVKLVPRLELTQALGPSDDNNRNGMLDAAYETTSLVTSSKRTVPADTYSFGFTVTNTGAVTVSGIRIDNVRLAKAKATITCNATSLRPGASTTCLSTSLTVTPFVAKRGIGAVYSKATGTSSTGKRVVSNTASDTYGQLSVLGLQIESKVLSVLRAATTAARGR